MLYFFVCTLLLLKPCLAQDVISTTTLISKEATEETKLQNNASEIEKGTETTLGLEPTTKAADPISTSSSTSTTTSTSTVVTSAVVKDAVCTNSYGVCLNKDEGDKCSPDHAAVPGICDDANMICCVPSQKIEEGWIENDEGCMAAYGKCQIGTQQCDGEYDRATCGGPKFRKCCSPTDAQIAAWIPNDEECLQKMGECQLNTDICDGVYEKGSCGGPASRECCLPSSSEKKEWTTHDGPCAAKWGICQANHSPCSGGEYSEGLCGGPDARSCCVPSKETVQSWSTKDDDCISSFGVCQHKESACNGTTNSNQCEGPSFRVCCPPAPNVVQSWASDDGQCMSLGGTCQHASISCAGVQLTKCGGPADRVCCLKPNDKSSSKHSKDPRKYHPAVSNAKSTAMYVILGVSVASVIGIAIIFLFKRGHLSRTYKRVKDENWYLRNSDMVDESVNLTACDESVNYA